MEFLKSAHQSFSNWSGIRGQAQAVLEPLSTTNLESIVGLKKSWTARGQGKNYTDAGLHEKLVILNHRLNEIRSFNESTGVIRVGSGMILHDLLMWAIPKKWIVPTIPGTAYVSIGGMIASNVHGKNQYRVGSVGDYVESFVLWTPQGRFVCSWNENRELFDATIGGMGTTGLIEEVELRLQKLSTPYLSSHYVKTKTIEELVQFMEDQRNQSDFTISWVDQNSLRGNQLHALVEFASYNQNVPVKTWDVESLRSIRIPFTMPFSFVTQQTTKIFNQLVYAKSHPSNQLIHFYDFNFKLDKLSEWNRLYGPKGLIQYQCLVPKTDQTAANIRHVLSFLKDHGVLSSLVVIKMHKSDRSGYLSFSKEGMSVAMDFPCTAKNLEVLKKLTPWVTDIGGRLYLTKDRTMDSLQFHKMYAVELSRQCEPLNKIDPDYVLQSSLTRRLRPRMDELA